MKAPIRVAFLGYALGVTLKHLLRRNHSPTTPALALAVLSTIPSADTVLPTTVGRQIRLRRVTTPSAGQKSRLARIGTTLPERLDLDWQCSVNSATP